MASDLGLSSPQAQLGKIHSQLERLVRGQARVEIAVVDIQRELVVMSGAMLGSSGTPATWAPASHNVSPPSWEVSTNYAERRAARGSIGNSPMRKIRALSESGSPKMSGFALDMWTAEEPASNERASVRAASPPSSTVAPGQQQQQQQQQQLPFPAVNRPKRRPTTLSSAAGAAWLPEDITPVQRVSSQESRPTGMFQVKSSGDGPTVAFQATMERTNVITYGSMQDDVCRETTLRGDLSSARSTKLGLLGFELRPRESVVEAASRGEASSPKGGQPRLDASCTLAWDAPNQSSKSWVLKPTSAPRIGFDVFSCIVLLYDSVVVPYMLAWDLALSGAVLWLGWFALFFWTMDILLSSVTGYFENGRLVMSQKAVFLNYLRGGFPADLLVLICECGGLIMASLFADVGDSNQMLVLRLARVAKISRAVRILAKLRQGLLSRVDQMLIFGMCKFGFSHYVQVVQFFILALRLAFFILWLNHIGSCVWFAFGRSVKDDGHGSWLQTLGFAGIMSDDEVNIYKDAYLQGMYWSVASMFSGSCPMPPNNAMEVIFAECYIIMSALFVTSITSFLAAMLIESQIEKQEQTRKIRSMSKFLEQRKVSPILAMAIREQFLDRLGLQRSLSEVDIPSLNILSAELRADLRHSLYRNFLFTNTVLRTCDVLCGDFMRHACFTCTTQLLAVHEQVFVARTVMDNAFVVAQGTLHYHWTYTSTTRDVSGQDPRTMKVPVASWISELALITQWRTLGSLEALEVSELLIIAADAFAKVLRTFVEAASYVSSFAIQLCSVIADDRDYIEAIQDVSPGVDYDFVMSLLPQDTKVQISGLILDKAVLRTQTSTGGKASFRKRRSFSELQREVSAGRCIVCISAQLEPYCVFQVVSMRLQDAEGYLCVKLAEHTPVGFKVCFHLPRRTLVAQSHDEAIEELLFDFAEIASHIKVLDTECDFEEIGHSHFGVAAKYIRHSVNMVLQEDTEVIQQLTSHSLVEKSTANTSQEAIGKRPSWGMLRSARTISIDDSTVVTHSSPSPVLPGSYVPSSSASGVARSSRGSSAYQEYGTRTNSTVSSNLLPLKLDQQRIILNFQPKHPFALAKQTEAGTKLVSVYGWIAEADYGRIIARHDLAEMAVCSFLSSRDLTPMTSRIQEDLDAEPQLPSRGASKMDTVCELRSYTGGLDMYVVNSAEARRQAPPERTPIDL